VDKAHNALLARVGTALYQQVEIQQADLDAVYNEIEALIAEVERLRGERAAVVAWLRSLQPHNTEVVAVYLQMLADVIERGEHRREEDE